jgi:hypothetical protein
MLWFLRVFNLFVVDNLILLFVTFVELLETVYASFLFMRIIFVVYVYVQELVSEKPTRGMLVKSP